MAFYKANKTTQKNVLDWQSKVFHFPCHQYRQLANNQDD